MALFGAPMPQDLLIAGNTTSQVGSAWHETTCRLSFAIVTMRRASPKVAQLAQVNVPHLVKGCRGGQDLATDSAEGGQGVASAPPRIQQKGVGGGQGPATESPCGWCRDPSPSHGARAARG